MKKMNVTFTLPDPTGSKKFVHAEVGGIAKWKSTATNFPKFQVNFDGPNPQDNTVNASFNSDDKKTVALQLHHSGHFNYVVKHIRADNTFEQSKPFPLVVTQAADNSCPFCPPLGMRRRF